ncbi:AAA family ATPase, partial [Methylopila henanensis]
MNFTKLRVVGFKTFVEPTDAPIEPGLTGIVGPNGCGKSNLVEAMRWVMGESSFKSLRASGMEDVIFAGSGGRPARNHTEVTLTLDNSARTAPEPFNGSDEIEVSRRIARGLGSTYRINGREVRARDVQLLFADASSGARSPALVGQGRVGEIINARPEQRRRILEEAAGIAGLHQRRREAEQRLDGAEQNLARVEDVLGQLDQRGEALRRQAKTAERYRALTDEIRSMESVALVVDHQAAAVAEAEAASAEAAAVAAVGAAMREQGEAARAEAVAAHALGPARSAAADAEAERLRLAQEAAALEGEEARARSRLDELARQIAQIDGDLAREAALAEDAAASLSRLAEAESALGSDDPSITDAARAEVTARLEAAENRLAEAEAAVATATAEAAARLAERRDLARRRDDASARRDALAREAEALAREAATLAREAGALGDADALALRAEEARARAGQAERAAEAAEAAHVRARSDESAARGPAAQANARAERASSEARTLAKLLATDAGRAFPAALELLVVDRGFETALGAALGDDLDAAIDPRAPIRWAGAEADAADPALPAGVTALGVHVVAPPELARRLAQIGVVDRADGERLRRSLAVGQRLVSREGDLWRWDGLTLGADAPTPAARRLQEKNRLGTVEREAAAARAEADRLRLVVDEARR